MLQWNAKGNNYNIIHQNPKEQKERNGSYYFPRHKKRISSLFTQYDKKA